MVRGVFLAAFLGSVTSAACAGPGERSEVSNGIQIGCYALAVGPWSGTEPSAFKLPERFRLDTTVGEPPFFPEGARRAHPVDEVFSVTGATPRAYWSAAAAGRMQLVWTDGFVGVELEFDSLAGDTLIGVAFEISDMGGMDAASADVRATPVRCES